MTKNVAPVEATETRRAFARIVRRQAVLTVGIVLALGAVCVGGAGEFLSDDVRLALGATGVLCAPVLLFFASKNLRCPACGARLESGMGHYSTCPECHAALR